MEIISFQCAFITCKCCQVNTLQVGPLTFQGVMVFGGYSVLWAMSGKVVEWLGFPASGEIPQTVVFVGLRSVLSTIINLPWSVYFTFWVEQKHGFNKQV